MGFRCIGDREGYRDGLPGKEPVVGVDQFDCDFVLAGRQMLFGLAPASQGSYRRIEIRQFCGFFRRDVRARPALPDWDFRPTGGDDIDASDESLTRS